MKSQLVKILVVIAALAAVAIVVPNTNSFVILLATRALAFAVVIIGGMGSLGGAAIGALLVGLADNFGKALFPEISYFTLYAPMALILAVKPTGLFGRE